MACRHGHAHDVQYARRLKQLENWHAQGQEHRVSSVHFPTPEKPWKGDLVGFEVANRLLCLPKMRVHTLGPSRRPVPSTWLASAWCLDSSAGVLEGRSEGIGNPHQFGTCTSTCLKAFDKSFPSWHRSGDRACIGLAWLLARPRFCNFGQL